MRDRAHDIFIQNTHSTRSDGAGSKFLETRDTELAHDKNVERCTKALCNFVGNRHAAAGQAEHDYVVAICIFPELLREQPPRFNSVWKSSFHAANLAALCCRGERRK